MTWWPIAPMATGTCWWNTGRWCSILICVFECTRWKLNCERRACWESSILRRGTGPVQIPTHPRKNRARPPSLSPGGGARGGARVFGGGEGAGGVGFYLGSSSGGGENRSAGRAPGRNHRNYGGAPIEENPKQNEEAAPGAACQVVGGVGAADCELE